MVETSELRWLFARLRAADTRLQVFGASSHRYRLEPPLAEPALLTWEREHGVELPGEYRAFLRDLGNGGAGPAYGIFPLGLWDGAGGPLEPWADAVGDLRAPFPHGEAWNLPEARFDVPEGLVGDEEDAWHSALDEEYWGAIGGAFWICHHGCAIRTLLVVTGPERGNVWWDDRANQAGVAPHTDATGRHLSFGEWYREWLVNGLREASAR